MGHTRRTQLLMDPAEFRRLQAIARRKGISVAELIRAAVRTTYLTPAPDRGAIVDAILALRLPTEHWESAKAAIERGHADVR